MIVNSGPPRGRVLIAAVLTCILIGIGAWRVEAATFHVDAVHPLCSDSGTGSASAPYCSISAAASPARGAGDVVLVHPAVYREQVNVPSSGTSAGHLIIRSAADGVVIDGADDLSHPSNWLVYGGDILLAPAVTWSPSQVFADGLRLTPVSGRPAAMPKGAFQWGPGAGLFITVGGGGLEGRQIAVGRRAHGFRLVGLGWVRVEGFAIVRTDDRAIHIRNDSHHVEIIRNNLAYSGRFGMQVDAASNLLIRENRVWESGDHGIHLTGVTDSTIELNESFRNARPSERAANGIMVRASSFNLIRWNRIHHNQDTGLHIDSGSTGNLSVQNLSWSNGDHGYDHLGSTGNVHNGDVAWGNFKDGFSVESNSTGTTISNSIGMNNGLTTLRFDLFVDDSSTGGFASDHNIFWNDDASAPVRFGPVAYATLPGYATATGHDQSSLEEDPRFMDPVSGNFHLTAGSPGIDSADSTTPGWPATDASGQPPSDDPATPNSGLGVVSWGDRGALEYRGSGNAPIARLHVDMPSGTAPFSVLLDGTGTVDPDDSTLSYLFEIDDGSVIGPQPTATALHLFSAGAWIVRLTVTDEEGNHSSAEAGVVVTAPNHPPDGAIQGIPVLVTIDIGSALEFEGLGVDPDGNEPLGYSWVFSGAAPASTLQSPGMVTFDRLGSWDVTLTVIDGRGLGDPTPAFVRVSTRPPSGSSGRQDRVDRQAFP